MYVWLLWLRRWLSFKFIVMWATIGMQEMAISFCERQGDHISSHYFSSICDAFILGLVLALLNSLAPIIYPQILCISSHIQHIHKSSLKIAHQSHIIFQTRHKSQNSNLPLMLRQVLLKSGNSRRQLYNNKLVCGCLYRSFNDLEAGIFFKFAMNNGRLSKHNIIDSIAAQKQSHSYQLHLQRMLGIIKTFEALQILKGAQYGSSSYQLNSTFMKNVQAYIKQQNVLQPVNITNKPPPYEPKPYQFLQLLLENKMPAKCKMPGLSPYATTFSREQFMYIKSDISHKIGILIDGIIRGNVKNIEALVMINLLDSDEYYLRDEKINPVLEELIKIKLAQTTGENNQYFRISKYLEHFTFRSSKEKQINTKLNMRVIIQTNFKVFAVIKSHQQRQNKVIKKILSMLLRSQNQGVQYDQLFIGEIEMTFLKQQIFKKTMITTNQYFDFFKQYTDETNSANRSLGKWNKLKFIGLEGPSEQSSLPNNVRQEVKLWEKLKDFKDDDEYLNQK